MGQTDGRSALFQNATLGRGHNGATENARPENAGLENDGQLRKESQGLENAGLENDGQHFSKL